jgi:hypothetical protein
MSPRWGSKPRHTDRQVVGRNGDFDFDLLRVSYGHSSSYESGPVSCSVYIVIVCNCLWTNKSSCQSNTRLQSLYTWQVHILSPISLRLILYSHLHRGLLNVPLPSDWVTVITYKFVAFMHIACANYLMLHDLVTLIIPREPYTSLC